MLNAIMFLFGFSSVVSVYEISKTGRKGKTLKIINSIEKFKKNL